MTSRLFHFIGGDTGSWRIERIGPVAGDTLPPAVCLDLQPAETAASGLWTLRGMISNERYVTKSEKSELVAAQEGLGRPQAICAALIPIRKNPAWWALPQDERRRILEEQSRHIRIGLKYLPAIARRLHHCRDLSESEPFDFLTWFEFAPTDGAAFEDLVGELRATEEWSYVEREVDIRLVRD